MKILIFGAGVIGTIYGQALAEADHEVTHYVRPGQAAQYRDGIWLNLLDGRGDTERDNIIHYPIHVTERFAPADGYDLILVSVRHYQLDSVLPVLARFAGETDILFFNALWTDLSPIDRYLPRRQYLWGYLVAGGALEGKVLRGALMDEVRLGEMDGSQTERLQRVTALFNSARLKVDVRADMLGWLWTHFAQEAAIIGVALKTGSADGLMSSVDALAEAILCMRETWQICQARGVDLELYREEFGMYYLPEREGAEAFVGYFATHPLERRIMTAHTGEDELKLIFHDVLNMGQLLGVDTPHFAALESFVDAFHLGPSVSSRR